jgi:DNA helicase-2/ATP-dependent DNA helicase PcrA
MLDFSVKYQDTKIIVLKNNYRSNQDILDLCTGLIENNNERLSKRVSNIKKELISSSGKKSILKPKLFNSITKEEEQVFILSQIKERLEK